MIDREMILLALDESPTLSLMERALRAVDYEVAVVHEYDGLIKSLDESSPALLLIGETFNGRNGIQVAASQLNRFPTLPILLYAEKDTTGIVKAVLQAGLSGYLHPPLKTDDIVDAVKRSLAHARHLGDWIRREVKRTTSSLEKRAPPLREREEAPRIDLLQHRGWRHRPRRRKAADSHQPRRARGLRARWQRIYRAAHRGRDRAQRSARAARQIGRKARSNTTSLISMMAASSMRSIRPSRKSARPSPCKTSPISSGSTR